MPTQPAVLGTARLGNFRLGYNPLAQVRSGRVRVEIAGVLANAYVRRAGLTVQDRINDAPNTCSLVVDGTRPSEGQDLRVYVNSDDPRLLFNGTLQTVDETYEGKPDQLAWACTAVDDLTRLNRIRPFGTWTNVSATTIAQELLTDFAPGFTGVHIEAALPTVSIIFDGQETFSGCLARLSAAIGGYFYVEDLDLHLFLTETTDLPDDIDSTPDRFLNNPPIRMRSDDSQLRTRVYGKGHGENLITDVAALETILPIRDAAMPNPAGGQVIAGTTPDGAQSQILNYTGVQLGGGGSLVGPGASPSSAPNLALAAGAGVTTGSHDVATVFVTAAGQSLPGPVATISVGLVAAPSTAAVAGTPTTGGSMDAGTHRYYPVFRAASGSTTAGPVSNSVTALAQQANPPSGTIIGPGYTGGGSLTLGSTYEWAYTYRRDSDGAETLKSGPIRNGNVAFEANKTGVVNLTDESISAPAGFTLVWYRSDDVGVTYKKVITFSYVVFGGDLRMQDGSTDASLGSAPPASNNTLKGTSLITSIPVYPSALVTHVDMYREFNAAGASTAKLAFSVTNGTTSASDTVANAGLGATVPSSNTATANQISVTAIPIGAAAVTARELFMSPAGGGARKLALTIANNTATTGTITISDASLASAAAEPTVDTSGLTQPDGQVNPGATAILVAGLAPFNAGGGWWFTGTQTGRYTGFTGSSLTGVTGIVQALTYNTVIAAAPALTGVTGNTLAMLKGTPVHIWVERNDLTAQGLLIALDAAQGRVSDGVVEHVITDMRRGEASLIAMCDADLERFSRPIVTVTFDARDIDLKSGKPITFNLTSPAITETLTLMSVDVSEIDIVPSGLAPRFHCVASNTTVSLESLLRKLLTKAA